VASKLRILTKEQRIIAEKLINDVLYEAQLGSLTRNSRLSMNLIDTLLQWCIHIMVLNLRLKGQHNIYYVLLNLWIKSLHYIHIFQLLSKFLFSDSVVCDTDLYYFHIIYLFLDCTDFNKTVLLIVHKNRLFIMFLTLYTLTL
jgi:hypothetical protein